MKYVFPVPVCALRKMTSPSRQLTYSFPISSDIVFLSFLFIIPRLPSFWKLETIIIKEFPISNFFFSIFYPITQISALKTSILVGFTKAKKHFFIPVDVSVDVKTKKSSGFLQRISLEKPCI